MDLRRARDAVNQFDIKNTKCFKAFKMLLIIWQLISVLMILVFDIMKAGNKFKQLSTRFERAQCLAAIFFTSSNAKTLASYAGLVSAMIECHKDKLAIFNQVGVNSRMVYYTCIHMIQHRLLICSNLI